MHNLKERYGSIININISSNTLETAFIKMFIPNENIVEQELTSLDVILQEQDLQPTSNFT
jgi:hypothetical protein